MTPFALSNRAKQDYQAIIRYTAKTWGKDQARTYAGAIIAACEGLVDGRVVSRPTDDIRQGLRKAKSGSHVIYFEVQGDEVFVIRILHQAMDAGQHF
ncbi:MAG: type II toxin-antitoxin system RelE/ParE family toxin [Litorimonas sp.]